MDKLVINPKYKATKLNNILKNQYTFERYYYWIKDLAISLFNWKNLPEGTDSRFLETTLFERGSILFFYDEVLDKYLNLPFVNSGNLDVYGYPINRQAYSISGYNKMLDNTNSVIIYNNSIKQPDIKVAQYYAEQIYEIKRAIDTNVKTMKLPYLITAPQQQVQTIKNLYKKIDENEVAIFANDKILDYNSIQVIQTNVEYVSDKLYELYKQVIEEVCEYFGINGSLDKNERMVVSEVVAGIGMTEANRQIRLKARKDACKQINEMFGLNVDVEFREDVDIIERLIYSELMDIGGETDE